MWGRFSLVAVVLTAVVIAGVEASTTSPVHLNLDGATLADLCKSLTKQTGLTHRTQGPEGTRLRICLFASDEPPDQVRQAANSLLKWNWKKDNTDGDASYTFLKPRALALMENELRQRYVSQYAAILGELSKAAASDTESKGDSLLAQQLQQPTTQRVFRLLGRQNQREWGQLLTGGLISHQYSACSSQERAEINGLLKAHADAGGSYVKLDGDDRFEFALVQTSAGRPSHVQLRIIKGRQSLLEFYVGHSALAALDGRTDDDPQRREWLRKTVEAEPWLTERMLRATPLEWPKSGEPTWLGWQLRDLARRVNKHPILADCYPLADVDRLAISTSRKPWPSPNFDGRTPLQALEMIRETLGYDWRIENGWILLRYDEWFWEAARPAPTNTGVPKRSER